MNQLDKKYPNNNRILELNRMIADANVLYNVNT